MVVSSILHLSDVHIRAGDSERSREEEYRAVFEQLFATLRRFEAVAAGEAIIVVTGDVFHHKHKLDPHGVRLGVQLLRGLAEIAPTFVIRGNHDYRQDQPEELDLISAITSYEIPNLTYLDETGTYEVENVGIGLVAIQDTLLYGATSGIVEELPPFPSVTDFSTDVTHKVALFHGSVVHAKLQNGMACETGHGYPLEWFKGYDMVLLGDIHLQQVHRATELGSTERVESGGGTGEGEGASLLRSHRVGTSSGGGTWAYPGSLLQQDFGEPLLGHGILHWNLKAGTVEEYHVWNPYGYVTLQVKEGDVRCFHRAQGALRGAWVPLQEMLAKPWFPQKLSVRVMTDRVSDLLACRRLLEEAGRELTLFVQIRSGGERVGGGAGGAGGAGAGASVKDEKGIDGESEKESGEASDEGLPDINSPALWSQFVKENAAGRLEEGAWERWLASPETMLVPTEGLEEGLVGMIRDKNEKVFRAVEALRGELDVASRGVGSEEKMSVRLLRLEWSWLFNFGSGNSFDFEAHDSKICVLNAKNGCGKSNFFEVVCVALFGTGFPSRHNKSYAGAILNRRMPIGDVATGAGAGAGAGAIKGKRKGSEECARSEITFAYGGRSYRLLRSMVPRKDNRNLFDFNKITLSVLEGETWTIIHQKKLAVDTWLEEHLGTAETFLSSAMLTQDGDYNFFELDKPSQKRVLDNVFSLGPVQALSSVFAEAIKAHKTGASHGRTYLMGQARKGKRAGTDGGAGGVEEAKSVDALRLRQGVLEGEAETLRKRIEEANAIWSSHPLRVFREKSLEAYVAELAALEAELGGAEKGGEGEESVETLRERKMRLGLERERLTKKLQGKKRTGGMEGVEKPDVEDPVELERRYKRLQTLVGMFGSDEEEGSEEGEEGEEDLDSWEAFAHEKRAWIAQWKRKGYDVSIVPLTFESDSKIGLERKGVDVERLEGGGGERRVDVLRSQLEEHERQRPLEPARSSVIGGRKFGTEEELVEREKRLVAWKQGCEAYGALSKEFDGIGKELAGLVAQKREYGKLPFNSACDACKAQPWRSVLEAAERQLPLLQKRCDEVCEEMEAVLERFEGVEGGEGSGEGEEDTLRVLQKACRTEEALLVTWRQSVDIGRWTRWKQRDTELRGLVAEAEAVAAMWDEKGAWERRQLEVVTGVRLAWRRVSGVWDAWRLWQDAELWRLSDLAERNFNAADSELMGRVAREKTVGKIEVLREVVRVFPAWVEEEALRRQLGSVEKELSVVIETLDAYENAAWRESMERWIDAVESRQKALEVLAEVFKGYRAWVYKALLGPRIGGAVNGLLVDVCDDRPLVLDAEWNDDLDTYTWFLVDAGRDVRNILEKASGFQRFIVGLAMRVAMSRLGICKVVYEQLFIDEGFTACDSDNLEKAPAFLKALLEGGNAYRCIVLATHLEELKACGDVQIGISLGGDCGVVGMARMCA